jgi:hypothetical protein
MFPESDFRREKKLSEKVTLQAQLPEPRAV